MPFIYMLYDIFSIPLALLSLNVGERTNEYGGRGSAYDILATPRSRGPTPGFQMPPSYPSVPTHTLWKSTLLYDSVSQKPTSLVFQDTRSSSIKSRAFYLIRHRWGAISMIAMSFQEVHGIEFFKL